MEPFEYKGWTFKAESSHISGLKELEDISSQLTGMMLPEMVFGSNKLCVQHTPSGLSIDFNAIDALKACTHEVTRSVKVACAETWTKSSAGDYKTFGEEYDWTFTTAYDGSVSSTSDNLLTFSESETGIDYDQLKIKEPILWFQEVHLYEDELHDHGISQLSVKIRVMPSCFYILMRLWLRVDNVLLRIVDTRFYHKFGTNTLTREKSMSEESFDNIFAAGHSKVLSSYSDPNTFQHLLKRLSFENEVLNLTTPN